MEYNTYTLENGLRIIHLPSNSQVVYCGYQIKAGSRDEQPGKEGLAHFCEHMSFKGTKRRKAWHILNYMESVGGDLNAYTNKDSTVYYSACLKEHTARAVDLLSDIVFHSIYPQPEIDKEVEVICDEIESYNDSPAELIYDEFENTIFEGHALGHNILGTAEKVRSFTTQDAIDFTQRHYVPGNAIFFAYGDIKSGKLVRMLEKATKGLKTDVFTVNDNMQHRICNRHRGTTISIHKNTHQNHVMIGAQAFKATDERRMPLYLINNILGGPGMNSRLNIALREHNGLVYTVESNMVCYGDTGLWCTYFGCDEDDRNKCIRLAMRELDRLADKKMPLNALQAAKKQLKGQIGVACDNRENFALDFGKSFLHYGWEKDIATLYEHIDAITQDEILDVAQELFDKNNLTTLIFE